MWFVGLLLGAWIGATIDGFNGAIGGGLIGFALGFGLRQLMRRQDTAAEEGDAQRRLAALEARLLALEARLVTLEGDEMPEPPAPTPALAVSPVTISTSVVDARIVDE